MESFTKQLPGSVRVLLLNLGTFTQVCLAVTIHHVNNVHTVLHWISKSTKF